MRSQNTISSKKKSHLSGVLFYVFALVLFVLAVYYFSTIKKDIKLFEEVNFYWLCGALAGQFFTYFFGAVVYRTLLRVFAPGQQLSTGLLIQASIVSLFLNQTLPSAGVSGNAFFYTFLGKQNVAARSVVSLILVELLTFYAAIEVALLAAAALMALLPYVPFYFYVIAGAGGLVYLGFGLSVGYLGSSRRIRWAYEKLERSRFLKKLLARWRTSFTTEGSRTPPEDPWPLFRRHKAVIARAIVYQLCIFASDTFTLIALFYGLGEHVDTAAVFAAFMLTKVISLLPVSPGALILYESSMTFFFVQLGTLVPKALVVTLLYRVLSFWLPMPLGFFMYRKLQRLPG